MIFKNFVFIFFLSSPFVYGTERSLKNDSGKKLLLADSSSSKNPIKDPLQNSVRSSKTSQKEAPESVPAFDRNNPQAKGLILAFHRWPNEKEKRSILDKLTTAELKKKSEIQEFKVWVFEWPEWRKGVEAEKLCKEISDLALSFLDYCEPDYLLGPARRKKKRSNQSQKPKKSPQPITYKPEPVPTYPIIPPDTRNVRSCKIVSSELSKKAQFMNTHQSLSDYWAQEMVGSDLLKKELKKAPPVQKHLVTVFDSTRKEHGIGVKNLVSDEGKHSVLPEMGSRISLRDVSRTSYYLYNSNNLLNKVQKVCGERPQGGNR